LSAKRPQPATAAAVQRFLSAQKWSPHGLRIRTRPILGHGEVMGVRRFYSKKRLCGVRNRGATDLLTSGYDDGHSFAAFDEPC
jgi:hypothetical protein